VKTNNKLLLLVLLAESVLGFGQQQPASKLESFVDKAQQAQAANDFIAAAGAYKQAVKIEPNMPQLWANLGIMQHQSGDFSGAILSFQTANHLNPALYVPNLFLGLDLIRTGKSASAIPYLLKAEKINKTDAQPTLALGRAYLSVRDLSAATQALTRAVTIDPKLSSAWFTLGIACLDQVEQDARKMSDEGKNSSYAEALFAESLAKQGRYKEADKLYREILSSQPQPPCMHSALGLSLLKQQNIDGAASEFSAEQAAHPECGLALLGQALIAIHAGNKEQAVQLLEELWNRDPGFAQSNFVSVQETLPAAQQSDFVNYLTQMRASLPPDFYNSLIATVNQPSKDLSTNSIAYLRAVQSQSVVSQTAESFYAAGQFQQCAARINPITSARQTDKLLLLARCSYFQGDYQRAAATAASILALHPTSIEALYWSIQSNERLAFNALDNFHRLEPDSARSHILLGDIYRQREMSYAAEIEYRKALAIEPNDPAAMLGLTSAYLGNNNLNDAIQTAQAALVRNPDDPELNLLLAEAMIKQFDFAEAEPHLEKSLHAKPQMLPHVHALMGKVYAQAGRTQDAIVQLKLGESSDDDGSVHYQLARLYHQVGDSKNAAEALDQMKQIKQRRTERPLRVVDDSELPTLEATQRETPNP
jgi:tetratricopeptide (TPR) repeat protein